MKGCGDHPGKIGSLVYINLPDLLLFFQGENADKPSPVKIEVIHRPLFDQYTMNPFDFPPERGKKQRMVLGSEGSRGNRRCVLPNKGMRGLPASRLCCENGNPVVY